jgi:hypothetical protein
MTWGIAAAVLVGVVLGILIGVVGFLMIFGMAMARR